MSSVLRSPVLKRKYGTRPTPDNHPLLASAPRAVTPELAAKLAPAPAAVDLSNWFPGIRDQGNEGSCTGFSTAQFREILWGSNAKKVIDTRLAPAYLYARTRIAEGTWPSDSGATIADEFAVLSAFGVCPELDMPYDAHPDEPVPNIADAAAAAYRIGQPLVVNFDVVDSVRTVLASGMPISIALPVYQSFEDCTAPVLPIPDPTKEALVGGHGILVCGYDDGRKCYRVINQWGTGWADKGFAWMPYDYAEYVWEAWTASLTA